MPLLQRLPTRAVEELWCASSPRHTPAGGTIVEQGAPADHLILLLSGTAISNAHTIHGRSVVLDTWTAPAALDKVVTFSGGPHPGTILATDAAWWCALPKETLDQLLDRHPQARRHVVALVAQAARQARSAFIDVSTRPTLSRIATWLLDTAQQGEVALPGPQEQLAHQLGMSRVTFNRGLHHLAKANVIAVDRHCVTIHDGERLREVADRA